MNIMLELAYDGTAYHGWQRQNNALSVCEVLEGAIEKILKQKASVTGCSRTDAGVHALRYVCNFRAETAIPMEKLPAALHTKLPRDIRIYRAAEVPEDFHARFGAKSKTYVYKTCCDAVLTPFLRHYTYHFPYQIDFSKIRRAAGYFPGTHDFSAFMTQGSSQKTTIRTVNRLEVRQQGGLLEFEINANAYLYNMVRIIAGTLLYTGIGRIAPDDIPQLFETGDRRGAGITAGAQGLYLKEILY